MLSKAEQSYLFEAGDNLTGSSEKETACAYGDNSIWWLKIPFPLLSNGIGLRMQSVFILYTDHHYKMPLSLSLQIIGPYALKKCPQCVYKCCFDFTLSWCSYDGVKL